MKMDFKNKSGLDFTDISSEEYREYHFSAGNGTNTYIRIEQPLQLNVSKSGGHRVFDAQGVSHYVPAGWIHLEWKSKEGEPHFVL
jgi:hypothetical protein